MSLRTKTRRKRSRKINHQSGGLTLSLTFVWLGLVFVSLLIRFLTEHFEIESWRSILNYSSLNILLVQTVSIVLALSFTIFGAVLAFKNKKFTIFLWGIIASGFVLLLFSLFKLLVVIYFLIFLR